MLPASSHNYNIAYRRTHNTKEEKDRSVYSPPCGVCRLQQGGQHHHHHHLQHSHHHHGASLPPPHDSHCLTFRGLASSALAMMRPPNTTVRPHSSAPHCPASPVGGVGRGTRQASRLPGTDSVSPRAKHTSGVTLRRSCRALSFSQTRTTSQVGAAAALAPGTRRACL